MVAIELINKLFEHSDQIIFIGGSYLYIHHLLYIDQKKAVPPDEKLRKELEKLDVEKLQKKLQALNKDLFAGLNKSDRCNRHRLIRKIEISQSIANYQEKGLQFRFNIQNKIKFHPSIKIIGLKHKDKEALREKIGRRVRMRLAAGAVEEGEKILKLGYSPDSFGLKTIGCQQIIKYLHHQIDYSTMIEEWINKEVQYAKRQYTFMKRDPHIEWRKV